MNGTEIGSRLQVNIFLRATPVNIRRVTTTRAAKAAKATRAAKATKHAKPASAASAADPVVNGRVGHLIGYARCSSVDQSTAVQEAKLREAGCAIIRTEKASGRSRDGREELESILAFIRPGDTLVVLKLDRLGRSTRDVLNLVHELEQRGASLRVLEPTIDTAGPMGRMVLTVLGMVAEMELGFIRDRQRAGIEAARAKGVYKGRPVTFDHAKIVALRKEGLGATEIARAVGCKRGNVYKALKAAGVA
jgi:DNA invertase Pin-like site-specific DNA recombinase